MQLLRREQNYLITMLSTSIKQAKRELRLGITQSSQTEFVINNIANMEKLLTKLERYENT